MVVNRWFVVMCWAVWIEFCKIYHDQSKSKESIKVSWAVAFLEEFQNSILSGKCRKMETPTQSDKVWKRPKHSQLRLDVDAGVDASNNNVSVGVVVRDTRGVVVGAKSCLIDNP